MVMKLSTNFVATKVTEETECFPGFYKKNSPHTLIVKRTLESKTCWPAVTFRPSTYPARGAFTTC